MHIEIYLFNLNIKAMAKGDKTASNEVTKQLAKLIGECSIERLLAIIDFTNKVIETKEDESIKYFEEQLAKLKNRKTTKK